MLHHMISHCDICKAMTVGSLIVLRNTGTMYLIAARMLYQPVRKARCC